MGFLPLSSLVIGALAIGLLVVAPFCVLMWRAGYNVAWASLPFAAALLIIVPVSARPVDVVVVGAVYLLGLYAFVLTAGPSQKARRQTLRQQKRQGWQPIEQMVARPAVASRAATMPALVPARTGPPMVMLPNGTVRPAPWAPRVPVA